MCCCSLSIIGERERELRRGALHTVILYESPNFAQLDSSDYHAIELSCHPLKLLARRRASATLGPSRSPKNAMHSPSSIYNICENVI